MGLFDFFQNQEISCPYCKEALSKMPTRKIPCPFCKKYIFVRTDPKTKYKILVTEKGKKEIEKEWEHYLGVNKWLSNLESFGVIKKDFDTMQTTLRKRFNNDPYPRDVIWGLFNKTLSNAININDLQTLGGLYYSMAIFLNEENKNPAPMLEQSKKMELLNLRSQSLDILEGVEILADGCDECKKLNKKTFTINEALSKMPLPNKECTFKLDNKKYSFCRCSYLPVVKRD